MLIAVFLHGAILFLFNPKISNFLYNAKPLIVRLVPQDRPITMTHTELKPKPTSPHIAQATLAKAEAVPTLPLPATANEATIPDTPQNTKLDIAQLIQSAQHDASVSEKRLIEAEAKFAQTPVGRLQDELKKPHSEIHLANGMIKIITLSGFAICWQAVPLFQSTTSATNLYNIPMNCP